MKTKGLIAKIVIVLLVVMVVVIVASYEVDAQETRQGATIDAGFLIVPDGNQEPCSEEKPYILVLEITQNNDGSTGPGLFTFCVGNDEIPSSELGEISR
jgi:hypothetical protein